MVYEKYHCIFGHRFLHAIIILRRISLTVFSIDLTNMLKRAFQLQIIFYGIICFCLHLLYPTLFPHDMMDLVVQVIYRIKLPGPPILGEGKPENQNHAIIFTRGEGLQTIDMNQVAFCL